MLPQLLTAPAAQVVVSRGSPPTAMLVQVPTAPEITQLWQAPVQAALQQTPSAVQNPVVQSELALQACPFGSLVPHWLFVLRQVNPSVQFASTVQVVRQDGLVVLQT